MQAEVGWEGLKTRRRIHRLTLYHKLNDPTQHTPNYLTSFLPNTRANATNRRLRKANTHTLIINRTSSYNRSFIPAAGIEWNTLQNITRHLSHASFSKQLCERAARSTPFFYALGSKTNDIIHARLRMNMSELNSHLFAVQKTPSPGCRCGHHTENIKHFIFFCPNYTIQRNDMYTQISAIIFDFQNKPISEQFHILLHGTGLSGDGGRAVAFHFQKFLIDSRRFKNLC